MTRGESRLSEAGSAPNGGSTVYGMPTYENRRVAIDEVHARPYLLIESPRALVQLAFMNEGNLAKDKATLAEISSRMGASLPDQNSPLHGLTWDQGKLHCEKHTEFSTYLWSAPVDPDTGDLAGEDRGGDCDPLLAACDHSASLLPRTKSQERRSDCGPSILRARVVSAAVQRRRSAPRSQ